jgi:hypothetical protein
MPWHGIWFEHEAGDGGARSPSLFEGFDEPIVYPFVRNFVKAENERLRTCRDPSTVCREGKRFKVYYSIAHDGGETGLDRQGCRIMRWLFDNFQPGSANGVSARFSEIPVVIHEPHPVKAAALGNALTLLRFLAAAEDQAIAKMLLFRWDLSRGGPQRVAREYERQVFEFLNGRIFYPEGVSVFDVLERNDLREFRALAPCCETQIGFLRPLLEWVDECWPESDEERATLEGKLRKSLADESQYCRRFQ